MNFNEHYFEEGFFGDMWNKIKAFTSKIIDNIRNVFENLGWGETKRIDFSIEKYVTEAVDINGVDDGKNADLKSKIGYYIERVVAVTLIENLFKGKFTIDNANKKDLIKERIRYREENIIPFTYPKMDSNDVNEKIHIADIQGIDIGKLMYSEISGAEDSGLCSYFVELAGESRKFESAADIIVKKIDRNNLVEEIASSIKGYGGFNVNMVNSTFVSFLRQLIFTDLNIPENITGMKFIDALIEKIKQNPADIRKYGRIADDMIKINSIANRYTQEKKKNQKNPAHSKIATDYMNTPLEELGGNSPYKTIRDFVIQSFNEVYSKNSKVKQEINNNLLNMLGLDSDNIYIAVTTGNKNPKTQSISTYSNILFQELVKKLRGDIIVKCTRPEDESKIAFRIEIYEKTDKLFKQKLLALTVPLKEEGKLNLWLNFKEFFKK